jgi:hypothetical protein
MIGGTVVKCAVLKLKNVTYDDDSAWDEAVLSLHGNPLYATSQRDSTALTDEFRP